MSELGDTPDRDEIANLLRDLDKYEAYRYEHGDWYGEAADRIIAAFAKSAARELVVPSPQPARDHAAYADALEGGYGGYQAACYDCDWRAETVHPAGQEGKNAARVEAAAHIRETIARGEVGMPSPSRAGLEQIGWYDEEEVEFRYMSQGGQPTWGEYVPVFIARSSAGSPSPAVEKLRDERNEALAELHEANRWLWLAREQGFVPNSGAGSPSPEQITDEMVENGARWWWDHGMISPRSSISFDDSSHEEIKDGARSFARKFLVAACSVRGETT